MHARLCLARIYSSAFSRPRLCLARSPSQALSTPPSRVTYPINDRPHTPSNVHTQTQHLPESVFGAFSSTSHPFLDWSRTLQPASTCSPCSTALRRTAAPCPLPSCRRAPPRRPPLTGAAPPGPTARAGRRRRSASARLPAAAAARSQLSRSRRLWRKRVLTRTAAFARARACATKPVLVAVPAKTKEQWVEWVKNNDPAVCKCKAAA